MSLETPTTGEIADNILAQIEAQFGQSVPLLAKAFLRVLPRALAGVFTLLYKYSGFIFLQLFVSTASTRETVINGQTLVPLVEWGRLIGVGDPEPATRAELVVVVTVEVQSGILAAGSQLLFPSTGVVYVTTASVALDAPTKTVRIRAVSDQQGGGGAGAIGNLQAGDVVSFASPLANVARDAVVDSQVVTGADGESWDAYRGRVLRKAGRRPQGGAYSDYRDWGEEGAGILNVYPYSSASPGQIDVYVEATAASSGSADGIPTAAQLTEVTNLINLEVDGLASRRPVNAAVNVLPITRSPFDLRVGGLAADDVPAAQAAIEAAVDEYLRSRAPFIAGLSVLPRRNRITEAALAGVVDETASALGGSITTVVLREGGADLVARDLGEGETAKLGAISWT